LAELQAALHGLQDLRGRIERAGRQPSQYSIELRCRHLQDVLPQLHVQQAELVQQWAKIKAVWRAVYIRTLPPLET